MVYLSDEELNEKFNQNKKMIDEAYWVTREKYSRKYNPWHGQMQANGAIRFYFDDYDASYFTNDNNSRTYLKRFVNCSYQNQQILFDYSISSFFLNRMKNDVSAEELNMYANDVDGKLNYNPQHITKVVALSLAWSPYWTSQLIVNNKRLREALVENFIKERYIDNKAKDLDESDMGHVVNLGSNIGKKILSHISLNKNMLNMINQDEEELFDKNNISNKPSYGSK